MVSGKNLLPWITKLKVVTCEYGSPAQGKGLLAKMKQQKCFVECFVDPFLLEYTSGKCGCLSWFLME